MFTTLARLFPSTQTDPDVAARERAERVFRLHPLELTRWLEEVWASARRPCVFRPDNTFDTIHPAEVIDTFDRPMLGPPLPGIDGPCPPWPWHHLIYAYLLESTGIVEIFAEVVRRLVVGETIGTLRTPGSFGWLRATEQLFFREPSPFSVASVISEVRPHERVNRRNAYVRLLGMDLGHPVPSQWAATGPLADWKAATGAVNSDFPPKWNELLRQVWLGVENRANRSGPSSADPTYIAQLCQAIDETMASRRRGAALAREEFAYVSMLSWFHLTVNANTPILDDLQATAVTPAERLIALGQRVGMTPAARSRELFELAEPVSTLLRGIEFGLFNTSLGASALFLDSSALSDDVGRIINNWQSATGERVKERPVGTVVPGSGQPLRVPVPGAPPVRDGAAPAPVAAPATNGAGPAVPVAAAASNGNRP